MSELKNQTNRKFHSVSGTRTLKRKQEFALNAPSNLSASNVQDTSFDLSWTQPFSTNPIANYEIYQDNALLATVLGSVLTHSIVGLTANTQYDFHIVAIDNQANPSANSDTLTITTPSGSALNANFVVTPTSGTFPLNVSCDSFSTPSDGTIQFHHWDWGDGSSTSGGFANVPHTYNSAGTYVITLTIGDGEGSTHSTTRTVTVTAPTGNQPPTASFSTDVSSGVAPLTVNVNATLSSDSDGTIASYAWNFGNATSGTGVTSSVTYSAAGSYTITLTVTDDDGATNSTTKNITVTSGGGGGGEVISGVIHRTYAPNFTQSSGAVTEETIKTQGPYEYSTKGFSGEGFEGRSLVFVDQNPGNGVPNGKWLRTIRPGGLSAHTFAKAIRAVNSEGVNYPNSYSEFWMKMELFITDDWVCQNQGKPAYSWSNPNGTSPGSNPTNNSELLFHWFGPKSPKSSGLWPTVNPPEPGGGWSDQVMVMGIDVYGNDPRMTNSYSEPIIFTENGSVNNTRATFDVGDHCIFWVHFKHNTGSNQDGKLRGWWSKDGGANYQLGVDIQDMRWSTNNTYLQDSAFVQFYGGNGYGFEPGGAPCQNNGTTHPSVDYWLYVKELRTQTANPYPGQFV